MISLYMFKSEKDLFCSVKRLLLWHFLFSVMILIIALIDTFISRVICIFGTFWRVWQEELFEVAFC